MCDRKKKSVKYSERSMDNLCEMIEKLLLEVYKNDIEMIIWRSSMKS